MIRAIVITVIPLVLLVANCVVVPAACQRIKDASQPAARPQQEERFQQDR